MRRVENRAVFLVVLAVASAAWGQEETSRSPGDSSASRGDLEREQDAEDEQARRRFEEAISVLRSTSDVAQLKDHLKVLGDGFPESRPVLVEAARRDSTRVRALALKVLGDHGDAETDLDVVVKGLDDQSAPVRMAAVMALRQLGKDASPAILRHLAREREPNIRKLAVRNLKTWGIQTSFRLWRASSRARRTPRSAST